MEHKLPISKYVRKINVKGLTSRECAENLFREYPSGEVLCFKDVVPIGKKRAVANYYVFMTPYEKIFDLKHGVINMSKEQFCIKVNDYNSKEIMFESVLNI